MPENLDLNNRTFESDNTFDFTLDNSTDYRLEHTGYEEFRCPLCYEYGANEHGHPECHDEENAWYEMRWEAEDVAESRC